ncbi:MAG: hypothetical protein AAFP69_16595, partial [Planctomycetota bacterium]
AKDSIQCLAQLSSKSVNSGSILSVELPDLPEDLSEAIESMKLAVLRNKATGWQDVDAETVIRYLTAMAVLVRSRSE